MCCALTADYGYSTICMWIVEFWFRLQGLQLVAAFSLYNRALLWSRDLGFEMQGSVRDPSRKMFTGCKISMDDPVAFCQTSGSSVARQHLG